MPVPDNALADLVRYSEWASRKLLTFALTAPQQLVEEAIPNSHGGILKTFQHIYYADRVWNGRLGQLALQFEDPAPGPSLGDMDQVWWPVLARLASYADTHSPETTVTFRRINGDEHTLESGQIIRHVVNHATYHRGQIAAMLRQNGLVPPSTDLLYYQLRG